MDMSDIIGFRTAYLRLIAAAWNNRKLLQSLPKLTPQEVKDLLATYGHVWTWGGLDIQLGINGPVWSPVETGGWYGHGTSVITLVLPLERKKIENYRRNQGSALTDYYQQRPTLFGLPQLGAATKANAANFMQSYNASLGDFNAFLDFGGVTVRAVALAWHNDEFRKELVADALPALERWLGFHSEWDLAFKVEEDATAQWKVKGGWGQSLSRNVLKLILPTQPSELEIRAIALTAYNETGPQYPFTCCD